MARWRRHDSGPTDCPGRRSSLIFARTKKPERPQGVSARTRARFLQTDGGSSYVPVVKDLDLLQVACMAHIRRAVFEARSDAPLAVGLVLAAIQKLYRIESRAKAAGMSLEGRLELRQQEAQPINPGRGPAHRHAAPGCAPQEPLGPGAELGRKPRGPDGSLPGGRGG